MTRDEFIDGYLERSGLTRFRTPYGYAFDEFRRVALPCQCGEENCDGWAMVSADSVRWHLFQNGRADPDPTAMHTSEEGLEMAEAYFLQRPDLPAPMRDG